MADTITTQYVYPANLDGGANPVPTRKVVVHMTNYSDGTGETDAVKVRLTDLLKHDGTVPTRTAIEEIKYSIYGMVIRLEWDRAPNATIALLGDSAAAVSGTISFRDVGGLVDPGEEGDRTGNIMLTTVAHASGDFYDITLTVRLK